MSKAIYHAADDMTYSIPFIDREEEQERVLDDGRKIPYLYIHGGFENTGVKFSFAFPRKEEFKGRFFQYLSPFPGPDEEIASFDKSGENDKVAFTLLEGAYFVESNMGSTAMFGGQADSTIVWKSSAAVAEYSRIKAMEYYGCDRPYGYVYGGSGGGYKTMACIENTDAWDGAAPYVIGSPASLPNTITMHVQGQRVLRNAFGKIIANLDAGGSKNMYDGLNEDESQMLQELTRMGFPPQAWFVEAFGMVDPGSLPVLTPGVKMMDPTYFTEFWEKEGYLGAKEGSSAQKDRLVFDGIVKNIYTPDKTEEKENVGLNGVDDAWKKMLADGNGYLIELEEVPAGEDLYLEGVNITFTTGDAVGAGALLLGGIEGNYLTLGLAYGLDNVAGVLSKVKPGDAIHLDNSDYIAVQSYYQHQTPPDLSFHAWDQFRKEDGTPAITQRPNWIGPGFTGTGTVQDGNIQGKVIMVQSLMDESTCPWCADWYRSKVRECGKENDYRLYYMERCMHGDVHEVESHMNTNYLGALRQALLDLSDWAERGIEPIATTNYRYEDGQIIVPDTAEERGGVQPVAVLAANGAECTTVKAGETVTFTVTAFMPKDAGSITEIKLEPIAEKKFPNPDAFSQTFSFETTVENGLNGAVGTFETSYDAPGVYYASVRVKGNRYGDATHPFTQIKNIARAKIIVE
ncbi:MAG: hypothetical protein Q4B22_03640 [Eubacteriales bacterium]|nr:hypothetical protein [Eubacteriales bacterium]